MEEVGEEEGVGEERGEKKRVINNYLCVCIRVQLTLRKIAVTT